MRIAAFSPTAIAVLYVLAPTLAGTILRSKRALSSSDCHDEAPIIHTCYLQTFNTIDVEPRIYDPALFAGFHGTRSSLQKMSDG